jgi:hypothetical protein
MVRVVASTGANSGCVGDAVATTHLPVTDASAFCKSRKKWADPTT